MQMLQIHLLMTINVHVHVHVCNIRLVLQTTKMHLVADTTCINAIIIMLLDTQSNYFNTSVTFRSLA